ncbi:head-tail connector protein [Lactococcus garvieae]
MDDSKELTLLEKFKAHIHYEDGMDESLLNFYIQNAENYVKNATGSQKEYLVLMVASNMYEYRISEKELGEALDAMTPFFVQEAFVNEETNEQS